MYRFIQSAALAACLFASTFAAPAHGAANTTRATTATPAIMAVPAPSTNTGAVTQLTPLTVISQRLDRARNNLDPETGTSSYTFDAQAIQTLPRGQDSPLQDVLLQAPGVVKDSFGQIHVRGDHADVQYRINGILLPEFISGFGSTLGARFIKNLEFLTGSLPAQYGYRTAGVVDISTKDSLRNGGEADLYGGSHDLIEPSLEYGGSAGKLTYYATGTYLQNDLGIQSPTPSANPAHDRTGQNRGFGYVSYLLNDHTRFGAIFGHFLGNFQIPVNPGQSPTYRLQGVSDYPSSRINESQRELGDYGIAFLEGYQGPLSYQVALVGRYTSVTYNPDEIGDLIYNGVAAKVFRRNISNGLQEDTSYDLNAWHTLRWGLFVDHERTTSDNTSSVFRTNDPNCDPTQQPCVPITVVDNGGIVANLYGAYLQEQWQPLGAFTLNYGLRYDVSDGYVREHQLSPRINFVYKITDATSLHGGYSRYFTPPTYELITPTDIAKFENTTNQLPSGANTDVRAERDNYYDLGINQVVEPGWTIGLDAYYKTATDLLDEGQFGQALVYSPFNYARGKVWGIELSTSRQKGNLSTYFNAAYSRAFGTQVVSGQYNFDPAELAYIDTHWVHLDHDQTWTASGGVGYVWRGTHYTLDALFGSGLRRGFANTQSQPSYTVFNLGAWREVEAGSLGKLRVRVTILNLLDRVYELRDGSGIGVGAPQYGARRGFYLGISKSF